MRLTDLADYLRASGLTVVEHPGWKKRGAVLPGRPDTILAHHTATPARAKGDLPTLRLLVEGRSDLPGPLCQLALSRSGVVHVIASGKANHAGKGAWRGQTASARTIGIEAEHPGGTARWTPQQYAAYVDLCAALCRYLGVDSDRVAGHKEWALPAGRKPDPNFDMDRFRSQVRNQLDGKPTPPPEDDEMKCYVVSDPSGQGGDYGTNGLVKFPFESQEAKNGWAKAFAATRITLDLPTFDAIPTAERAL